METFDHPKSISYNPWVRMDYGFYGFKIHKIHNPWILKWPTIIYIDYGFLWILNSLWIFMDFKSIMDYGFFMEWIWI